MIDTNVLISAVYNPKSVPNRAIEVAGFGYTLVLCEYVVGECREIIKRKFPHRLPLFETLLESSELEIISVDAPYSFPMSDPKDQPILGAAVAADVDILISGDKHFLKLDIEHPVICTPAQFLDRFEK
jgi:predicted nucleic acid-binding protein